MGFQHRSSMIFFVPQECPISCSMQNELEADGKTEDEMGEQLAGPCSSPGERKGWPELTQGVSINIQ